MTFTVSLSGANPVGASVLFATTDGNAVAGSDYVAKSGTLTWAAGDTSPKTFNVVINGDPTVDDPEEFLFINLTNPVGATISQSQPQGSGDILNGTTGVAISDVTATEGNSGTKTFDFTVSRTGLTTGATSVNFATANGTATAGTDFVARTGTISWAANDTADKTISVTVNVDTAVEADENFFVNLSSPTGAILVKSQGVGTIQNDDTNVAINNVSITQGNSGTKTLNFTVTRTGLTSGASSVKFATANGTATAGSDYVGKSGTVSWAAGDKSAKTISITINGDTTVEPNETFFVNLSSATGATIATAKGIGTILNNATALAINNVSITEGDSGTHTVNFTVTRTGLTSGASSVKFATADGTATAGIDYVAKSGTLSWAAGDTSAKTISITIESGTAFEADETFLLNLSAATGAMISTGKGTGTILNDDPMP